MGATDVYALPWPDLPGIANGPDGYEKLAVATENVLVATDKHITDGPRGLLVQVRHPVQVDCKSSAIADAIYQLTSRRTVRLTFHFEASQISAAAALCNISLSSNAGTMRTRGNGIPINTSVFEGGSMVVVAGPGEIHAWITVIANGGALRMAANTSWVAIEDIGVGV